MGLRSTNPFLCLPFSRNEYMILDNLYLFLDLFTLSFPLFRSFDYRLEYYKKWYALFPSLFVIGAIFIVWDVIFTEQGVWGFNPRYLTGIDIINLPIEEWGFFLVVPFACLFIYEATLHYIKSRPLQKFARPFSIALAIVLFVIAILSTDKIYTFVTFLSTSLLLIAHVLFIKRDYLDRFYFGYIFALIPFLLVNGVLTGSFIDDQIVWYNDADFLGIRLFTIPIEDSIYLLLYLLGIVTIYEAILKRFSAVSDKKSMAKANILVH